jgi:hypothetical protein
MSQARSAPEASVAEEPAGHVRRVWASTRELMRIAYRDPEHVPERLTLHAVRNLAEPSRAWAVAARRARPDASPAELADAVREQSIKLARLDGAVAGTPFFVALVPGYLSYLWQETRMVLRTAALFGIDPADRRTAAEMLVLRDVHPTVEAAAAALAAASAPPAPVKRRRSLVLWMRSVRAVLVFGGFLDAPRGRRPTGVRARVRAVAAAALGLAVWATTWVLPVTCMLAMAWACESHARRLGLRSLGLYGPAGSTSQDAVATARRRTEAARTRRQVLRAVALSLSVAVPVAFVAYVDHVRQHTGINWLGAIGALVALSLVVAGAVYGSRR